MQHLLSRLSLRRLIGTALAMSMVSALAAVSPALGAQEAAAFSDVETDHVFSASVKWAKTAGVARGCNPPDNTRFCPDDPVSRGEMAAFLHRAVGGEFDVIGQPMSFSDTVTSVFVRDVAWLSAAGLTAGCNPPDSTLFCPERNVTRGEAAAFIRRAFNLSAGQASFADTVGTLFAPDIAALAASGVTRGCNPPDNTRFCPDEAVTRGQLMAFLHRGVGLEDDPDREKPLAALVVVSDGLTVDAGFDFELQLDAAGGTRPYRWVGDGFPAGVSLLPSGEVRGVVASRGLYSVTVGVTDGEGRTTTAEIDLDARATTACVDEVSISDLECVAYWQTTHVAYYGTEGDPDDLATLAASHGAICVSEWSCSDGHVREMILFGADMAGHISPKVARLRGLGDLIIDGADLMPLGDVEITSEMPPVASLGGTVPAEIGGLGRLGRLVLANLPNLEGSLPSSLANLESLQDLVVVNTGLSGPIDWVATDLSDTLVSAQLLHNGCFTAHGDHWEYLDDLTSAQWREACVAIGFSGDTRIESEGALAGQLSAIGGTAPFVFSLIEGPDWMAIDGDTGDVSGVAGSAGDLEVTVQVTDATGMFDRLTYALAVYAPGCLGNLGSIPEVECAALMGFHEATSGGGAWRLSWGSGDPCEWFGVACAGGHVSELSLRNQSVTGSIASALGALEGLKQLDLSENTLTGPIPDDLGQLASLEYLNLSVNALSGPIPTTLGDLVSVKTFVLDQNELDGSIPAELSGLPAVQSMVLYSNQLAGEISPTFMDLFDTLTTLKLWDNGCLTTGDAALAGELASKDPSWNDGCS